MFFRALKRFIKPSNNNVIYWQNATYSILTTLNGDNIKIIGGLEKDLYTKKNTKSLIKEWWDIKNRQELLDMLEKLKNGLHSNYFLNEVERLNFNKYDSKEKFILKELPYFYEDKWEIIMNIYDIFKRTKKYGETPLMGWDFCRATYLCHTGYIVDYLSYDEALDIALDFCILLQKKFESWDELIFNYLDGYQYWSNEFLTDYKSKANERLNIYLDLKNSKNSLFNIDWNLKLKKEW